MQAYIYQALRSPRTKAKKTGTLANVLPHALVSQLTSAVLEQSGGDAAGAQVDQLLLGCVGQLNTQGGNIALVSKLHTSLPDACAAMTLNHFCASGLSAVGLAANACALGQSRLALAGGVECLSQVGFMADNAYYYRDNSLPADRRYLPVALSADLLAQREQVGRDELDEPTALSHQRAVDGLAYQKSLCPVRGDDVVVDRDECPRADMSRAALANLEPAFAALAQDYAEALAGRDMTFLHTVANAPPMVDGAALALIGGLDALDRAPRARILDWTDAGADPAASLTGGLAAMDKLLARQKMTLADIDRIELMEAFAVVPALFRRRYAFDYDRVNVSGGHLAKGHPLGATGAVLLSTLCDVLEVDDRQLGLVVVTGASGTGSAMLIERVN